MILDKQIWKRASLRVWPALLFTALLLSGCDFQDILRSGSFLKKPETTPTSAEPANGKRMSPQERAAFYRWLVREMKEQIFARAISPSDVTDTDGWANVLSQSGSIEGVYHGFVLSTDYMNLEQARKPADIKALRFFGLEMALLDFPYATESDEKVQGAASKYVQDNLNTSIFTLKKELGERIIREAVKRKVDGKNWRRGSRRSPPVGRSSIFPSASLTGTIRAKSSTSIGRRKIRLA